ncbi:D-alanyl-lipoteichoic acid biosynthesis protein DltB [Lentilactobacillus diolivorans]|nr:D-alanyl-lipoteichoic acid biosynthesis protein DltB [Lentilactobacillus diolivorans]GEP25199.1 D-alanyl-lipoteichoic acid biosynthesis protein DltB [Lentilactobacillus diolivorans]
MSWYMPYGDPTYFVWLAIMLTPVIVGLLHQRRLYWYQTLVSLFFLVLTFGGPNWHTGIALVIYLVYQVFLVYAYACYQRKEKFLNQDWVFILVVLLAIGPLVIVKVTPAIQSGRQSFIGFLGISYITFKVVQTIMEIRDGMIKDYHPVLFGQFLLFFPTISSGPIDRYRRFVNDYRTVPEQQEYLNLVQTGIWYIFLGFLYKFVLAFFFGSVVIPYIQYQTATIHGFSWYFIGYMYAYSLDLFFDFAGYSLFAVGISYLMGIKTPMNFNQPFKSKNIKEFWNRWHMSLSFWFRDYVFMRLVFFFMKRKVFRSKVTTANVCYILNMLLMGLWHGETWFYVLYGLLHGTALVVNDAWLRFKKKHQEQLPHNKLTELFAMFITFNFVCFTFFIFSGFLNTLI